VGTVVDTAVTAVGTQWGAVARQTAERKRCVIVFVSTKRLLTLEANHGSLRRHTRAHHRAVCRLHATSAMKSITETSAAYATTKAFDSSGRVVLNTVKSIYANNSLLVGEADGSSRNNSNSSSSSGSSSGSSGLQKVNWSEMVNQYSTAAKQLDILRTDLKHEIFSRKVAVPGSVPLDQPLLVPTVLSSAVAKEDRGAVTVPRPDTFAVGKHSSAEAGSKEAKELEDALAESLAAHNDGLAAILDEFNRVTSEWKAETQTQEKEKEKEKSKKRKLEGS
jgi:hypothetical protein